MSLRRFNHIAIRMTQEMISRFLPKKVTSQLPGIVQKAVGVTRNQQRRVFSRNPFIKIMRGIRGNTARNIRPFAAIHDRQEERHRNRLHRTLAVPYSARPRGVFERVRGIFSTNSRYNLHLSTTAYPTSIDGYEIGAHIANGCNAAVYELRLGEFASEDGGRAARPPSLYYNSMESFPLALKIMFNYHYELPERNLWMDMGPELIPLKKDSMPQEALWAGKMANFRPLDKTHPNLIKLHTAFVDRMPILPGAENLYPEALPPASDDFDRLSVLSRMVNVGDPSTLLIVMKRYRMTLRDYVLSRPRNYWVGRVLYGQLLEAIVFLYEQRISHRDMKSDNVLLDFNDDAEVPHLVLSDFGSALAKGDFLLSHPDETTDLGGNLSLRAPEIRRAKPGPDVEVDFSAADLWAAATLGYEIFTRSNPFYGELSSEDYQEEQLPTLPRRLHYAVKEITYDMLKVDPSKRPTPQVAANVVAISLFRFGQDVRTFLSESCGLKLPQWGAIKQLQGLRNSWSATLNSLGKSIESKLDAVTQLYAAETVISRQLVPRVISKAELQLRATFLSRLNRDEVWAAMAYFLAGDDPAQSHGSHSHSSSSSIKTGPSTATTIPLVGSNSAIMEQNQLDGNTSPMVAAV